MNLFNFSVCTVFKPYSDEIPFCFRFRFLFQNLSQDSVPHFSLPPLPLPPPPPPNEVPFA